MKNKFVKNQVSQISLCRKGAWLNSGLPSALKRSFRDKLGLDFELSEIISLFWRTKLVRELSYCL